MFKKVIRLATFGGNLWLGALVYVALGVIVAGSIPETPVLAQGTECDEENPCMEGYYCCEGYCNEYPPEE